MASVKKTTLETPPTGKAREDGDRIVAKIKGYLDILNGKAPTKAERIAANAKAREERAKAPKAPKAPAEKPAKAPKASKAPKAPKASGKPADDGVSITEALAGLKAPKAEEAPAPVTIPKAPKAFDAED